MSKGEISLWLRNQKLKRKIEFAQVQQPISSRGSPTVLNPQSEHSQGVVALPKYSSFTVVEHPVKYVAPFGMFSRDAAKESR
ncbi:hypothetical protein Scep_007153 [Stephania cephalantha]|uniref:Uncharacterized protein n=1 Tax=Stephania cephalantha TaxID=152367 RepID=A0AAP0K9H4_9MAGN